MDTVGERERECRITDEASMAPLFSPKDRVGSSDSRHLSIRYIALWPGARRCAVFGAWKQSQLSEVQVPLLQVGKAYNYPIYVGRGTTLQQSMKSQ